MYGPNTSHNMGDLLVITRVSPAIHLGAGSGASCNGLEYRYVPIGVGERSIAKRTRGMCRRNMVAGGCDQDQQYRQNLYFGRSGQAIYSKHNGKTSVHKILELPRLVPSGRHERIMGWAGQ